jgi:hypothetical protein
MKVDNRRAAGILDHANDARDGGCLCGECGGSIREREDLLSDRAEMIELLRRAEFFLRERDATITADDIKALLASAEGAKEGSTG